MLSFNANAFQEQCIRHPLGGLRRPVGRGQIAVLLYVLGRLTRSACTLTNAETRWQNKQALADNNTS